MYLAKTTGNKCVRINNHEHTDLQEYIGSYCADPSTGNLVFREGKHIINNKIYNANHLWSKLACVVK